MHSSLVTRPVLVRSLRPVTLWERLCRLARALGGRSAAAELAALDERLLDDLGLTRADIAFALRRPLTEDPSVTLAALSAQRASAARDLDPRLADRPRWC